MVTAVPDALLLMTGGCPHCPAALQALNVLLKEGAIGRLQVINVAIHTEEAETRGVQSVPWVQIGPFEVEGAGASIGKLRELALGTQDEAVLDAWLLDILKAGQRQKFESLVKREPQHIHSLARLMTNPETSMAIRLGIGAVLEELHGTGLTEPLIPALGAMLTADDRLLSADAAHFLTLVGGEGIRTYLQSVSQSPNSEVRGIAEEWLAEHPPTT